MHNRRSVVRALAVLAVLLAVSFSGMLLGTPAVRADHNTVHWDVPTSVTTTTGIGEQWSTILSDGHGNLYVFFVTPSSFSQANLTVSKYHVNALGILTLTLKRTVNPTLGSVSSSWPIAAAMDHSGYLYVAWTESAGFTGGVNAEVMVSRSTDGADTWPQTVAADRVNSYGDDYSPMIGVGSDGSISVAWIVSWGGVMNMAYSRSTNQGATFAGFLNITNQGAGFGAYWPSMAVDSRGRIYLVYEFWNVPDSDYSLNYTWSDGGAAWAAPRPIVSDPAVPAYVPKIAVDSRDHVHVTWYSWIQTPAATNSLQYRVSTDRGVTWSPQIAVNQGVVLPNTFPNVAVSGDTVLVLTGYSNGVDYSVSADGGKSFYPEEAEAIASSLYVPQVTADQNGTIWMSYEYYNSGTSSTDIGLASWHAPPTTPAITTVSPGTGSLTVSWTASPEADVAEYRVYRSLDGSNYQIVGTVAAPATTFADSSLANGTYWYQVDAVDLTGLASHLSSALSGTVGPSTQDLINQLQGEITALQDQLAAANASSAAEITALRGQVSALQTQLTNLQNSQASSNAATSAELARLEANLTALQQKLNDLQSQQATQTISYANLAFEVIVVVLLVVLLLNQMRKPKTPQLMMAQPGQAMPKKPEDEL